METLARPEGFWHWIERAFDHENVADELRPRVRSLLERVYDVLSVNREARSNIRFEYPDWLPEKDAQDLVAAVQRIVSDLEAMRLGEQTALLYALVAFAVQIAKLEASATP